MEQFDCIESQDKLFLNFKFFYLKLLLKKCSHKVATIAELLIAKDEMLVANATISVAISRPAYSCRMNDRKHAQGSLV